MMPTVTFFFFSFSAKIREGITNLVLSVYWAMQLRRLGIEKWTGIASTSYAHIDRTTVGKAWTTFQKRRCDLWISVIDSASNEIHFDANTHGLLLKSIYSNRNEWRRITSIVNAKNKSNMIAKIRPVMYEYYSFCYWAVLFYEEVKYQMNYFTATEGGRISF